MYSIPDYVQLLWTIGLTVFLYTNYFQGPKAGQLAAGLRRTHKVGVVGVLQPPKTGSFLKSILILHVR